jgi:hypothetical protein
LWISASADSPIVDAGSYLTSAWRLFDKGRYGHAVLDCGTAIELIVNFAIREIGAVRGYKAQKLTGALATGFKNRTKHHFAALLGYDPNVEVSGDSLGRWWASGYSMRNKVSHTGYRPTAGEARAAYDTAEDLFNDVGDRMVADPAYAPQLPAPGYVLGSAGR